VILSDLAKYSMTRRSCGLCNSWASCSVRNKSHFCLWSKYNKSTLWRYWM